MEFAILGPLEARSDHGPVSIPGARQRAVLAMLLLHPGEVVSVDRLVDTVWCDDPPGNPRNALQSQISELRRRLGDAERRVLASRPPGYVMLTEPETIDAVRFERLVTEGRAALHGGDPQRGGERLRDALGLWRGAPLPEFTDLGFADAATARLEELRLGAIEDRIECDLRLGRHGDLVPELDVLVAEHPLRERLRGQLMLALARTGRQADALAVFHETRQILADELGIDPGRGLHDLYETLLRQQDEVPPVASARDRTDVTSPATSATSYPPDARTRLPRPFTSFVGRETDLERVVDLLRGTRLMTLTGPGGVGKTRLATEVALALTDAGSAPHGVWLVELAGLHHADLLWETVAEAIGVPEPGGLATGPTPVAYTRVTAALHDRRSLLVLDNGEHLIEAVASLAHDLLSATTELTVLCTSREPLGVPGETVWSVEPLPVPPPSHPLTPDDVGAFGAATLFVDRALDADPRLTVDDTTGPLIVEVCRRLDGVPLALELAAARVRTLGLEELVARLDDRFRVLTSGDRTAQPRQRTLRAVIAWSWDLLDEPQRTLLARLSVFGAPTRLAAVETVCVDDDQVPPRELVTILASLVDRSLVIADRGAGPLRYRMLQTIRTYAAERLDEHADAATVRQRHTTYVLADVAQLVPRLRGADQLQAMHELDAQLDDVRAVLHRLETNQDAVNGARLASELGWYWYLRGRRTEGLRALSTFAHGAAPREAALIRLWTGFLGAGVVPYDTDPRDIEGATDALAEHGSLRDRTFGELLASVIASARGDRQRSLEHLELACQLVARTGDPLDEAMIALATGNGELAVGDIPGAQESLRTASERFETLGDRWGQVQCPTGLLTCAEVQGDLPVAEHHAERGIELAVELSLAEMEAVLRCRRASLAVLAHEPDRAQMEIETAHRVADRLGSDVVAHNVDLAAGFLALRTGDLELAEERIERVRTWLATSPYPAMRCQAASLLGSVAERRGEFGRAASLHRESYTDARTIGDRRGMALALEGLAGAYAGSGRAEDAAVLLGAAETLRASVGLPLPEVERTDVARAGAAARGHLGARAFDLAVARGRDLRLDELPLA